MIADLINRVYRWGEGEQMRQKVLDMSSLELVVLVLVQTPCGLEPHRV